MSDGPSVFGVEISDGAMEDLRTIQEYIAAELQSPASAWRTVTGILDAADRLSAMPFRNRAIAKQVEGTPFVLLIMENIAYFTSLKRKKSSYLQCCTTLRMLKAGSGK